MSFPIYFVIFTLLNDIIKSYHYQNFNMKKSLFRRLSLNDNQLMNESNSYILNQIKNEEPPCVMGKIIDNNKCILPEESKNLDTNKCVQTYCSDKDQNVKCIENGLIPKCICSENYFGLFCELHNDTATTIKDHLNSLIVKYKSTPDDIILIKQIYYYISNFEKEINEENADIFEKLVTNYKEFKIENENKVFLKFTFINIGLYCAIQIYKKTGNIHTLNYFQEEYYSNLKILLDNNDFKYSQFVYLINDAYPMISSYFFTNNILSLQRMRKTSINNNLSLIDPSNCGSSLLTPTPNYPNSLYVVTVFYYDSENLNSNDLNITENIQIEAYLFDIDKQKPKSDKKIINQCTSLTLYMNPSPLINFTLISNYSNCSLNGIDIYNKNDPAFIDSCFICEGLNYDLNIEYNRNYIFQKYNFSTFNVNCSFEGIEQSIKKVKMFCSDLVSNNKLGYKMIQISNAFKDIKNDTTAFKCSNNVTKIHKNFAFWFYTCLNFVLLFLTTIFIFINNYESAIRNDNLNKGKIVSSKIIEKNDIGNDDDEDDNYESKNFGNCFTNNFFQLHPLISIFIPSIIRNQLISLWIFFFSLINIFGFNAVYFNDKMFENRINDSFRNNFFYPMKREFHRIIYSILTMMAFNVLIRLIVIVPLSKFNELSNILKDGNEETISECKTFECKMLVRRIIAIIVILIFNVFFYYYTIVFCAIYRNTQAGWFYSGIWGFIWNNIVFSLIYIIVISIVESNGHVMLSYYMKRLFCF